MRQLPPMVKVNEIMISIAPNQFSYPTKAIYKIALWKKCFITCRQIVHSAFMNRLFVHNFAFCSQLQKLSTAPFLSEKGSVLNISTALEEEDYQKKITIESKLLLRKSPSHEPFEKLCFSPCLPLLLAIFFPSTTFFTVLFGREKILYGHPYTT